MRRRAERVGVRPGAAGEACQRGLSLLEVLVALTLVAIVMFGSLFLVKVRDEAGRETARVEGGVSGLTSRALAQVGRARTDLADRPARAKTVATHWVQAELEYLRSLGFLKLQRCVLYPSDPQWCDRPYQKSGAVVYRDIRSLEDLAPGEMALPSGFGVARVILEVEEVEILGTASVIGRIRTRVGLFRDASELGAPGDLSGAFVVSATSVQRP